jgi:protein scribble
MGACLSDTATEPEQPLQADYQHCNLADVPEEIFGHVASLEEILLDSNALKQLPKALFNFTALVRLGLSDNEIESLSANIGNLIHLEELDISRNNIPDIPDDIRLCSKLMKIDCSVNPIGR